MSMNELDPGICLGDAGMDESHRLLLAALSRLPKVQDSDFAHHFQNLTEAFEADFREEEDRMEEAAYPGLRHHREQHARVLAALHVVRPNVDAGDLEAGRGVARLFAQWFPVHVTGADREFIAFLRHSGAAGGGLPDTAP